MQKIDNRLKRCAEYVTENSVAVDVGTDHAYLATYLITNNISKKVIACDINDGPLNSARQTLEKYHINNVYVVKSDGLDNIPSDGITDVVIAGMGGELISQILSRAEWLKNGVNIVLQPMTKVEFLRKWIYENGYDIINESICEDDDFLYVIMNITYTGNRVMIDEINTLIGTLTPQNSSSEKYILKQARRMKEIAQAIYESDKTSVKAQQYMDVSDKLYRKVKK